MKKPVLSEEHLAKRADYKARMLRTELGAVAEQLPADDLQVLLELARRFAAFDDQVAGVKAVDDKQRHQDLLRYGLCVHCGAARTVVMTDGVAALGCPNCGVDDPSR